MKGDLNGPVGPGLLDALGGALDAARGSLSVGDAMEAERSAKAISALAKAARDVSDLEAVARAREPEDNVDELRAELRRRLALFVAEGLAGAPADVLERIAAEGLPRRLERMGS